MPSPLRCPTVKRWMPECDPSTRPARSTISPGANVCAPLRRPEHVVVVPLDECGVVPVGDKTDLLAVRFLGDVEAVLPGDAAHLGLQHVAQRKHRFRQLVLGQLEQEVRLVLRPIAPAQQQVAAPSGVVPHACVMARGHRAGLHLLGHAEEVAELHVGIAQHTGRRRAAVPVALDERPHHLRLELGLEVQHIERETQARGDGARVVQVVDRTATSRGNRTAAGVALLVPQLHGETDEVKTLLLQNDGRRRAVDAAAHGDGDPGGLHRAPPGIHSSPERTR